MKKQEKTSPLEMISDWFSQYTLDYPNRDPDKISFYVVGWISIALLGMCVMFADIAAGVLLIVFFGLILTGIMLWKNPEVFNYFRITIFAQCIILIHPESCNAERVRQYWRRARPASNRIVPARISAKTR